MNAGEFGYVLLSARVITQLAALPARTIGSAREVPATARAVLTRTATGTVKVVSRRVPGLWDTQW